MNKSKKQIKEEKHIEITAVDPDVCCLCKGKGYYQDKKGGPVHTCFQCLKEGRLA